VALDPNSPVSERFGADVIQKREESSRWRTRLSLVNRWPCQIIKLVIEKRASRISCAKNVACGRQTSLRLLHGNPTWGFLYRDMIAPLVGSGRRVIVPDMIGFGLSENRPANKPIVLTDTQPI
jgi:pimeloyl-ACP methyl ester carboxylesterase